MLNEEQISFHSASLMFDGVEDYSHQIAEMIGLRNESNFIQAGVNSCLLSIEIGTLSVLLPEILWWPHPIYSYFTGLVHAQCRTQHT